MWGVLLPESPQHAPRKRGRTMDYNERLERLDRHIEEHPKDYQAVIGRMKCYSDAIEHQMYLRKIERLKRVAKFRREDNEQKSI